jgi:hypothetical protein
MCAFGAIRGTRPWGRRRRGSTMTSARIRLSLGAYFDHDLSYVDRPAGEITEGLLQGHGVERDNLGHDGFEHSCPVPLDRSVKTLCDQRPPWDELWVGTVSAKVRDRHLGSPILYHLRQVNQPELLNLDIGCESDVLSPGSDNGRTLRIRRLSVGRIVDDVSALSPGNSEDFANHVPFGIIDHLVKLQLFQELDRRWFTGAADHFETFKFGNLSCEMPHAAAGTRHVNPLTLDRKSVV